MFLGLQVAYHRQSAAKSDPEEKEHDMQGPKETNYREVEHAGNKTMHSATEGSAFGRSSCVEVVHDEKTG